MFKGREDAQVDVQLLDYGDVISGLSVFRCVRKIPESFVEAVRPQAFVVQVSDVVPVELASNPAIGMTTLTEVPAKKWTPGALDAVIDLVRRSPGQVASVTEWVFGCKNNRVFGRIEILECDGEMLDLQEFLLRTKFGMAYSNLHMVTRKDWVQEQPDLLAKRMSMCAAARKANSTQSTVIELPAPEDFIAQPSSLSSASALASLSSASATSDFNVTRSSIDFESDPDYLEVPDDSFDWSEIAPKQRAPVDASSYDPYSFEDLAGIIFQETRDRIIFLPAGIDLGRDAEERAKKSIKESEIELEQCQASHGHLFD